MDECKPLPGCGVWSDIRGPPLPYDSMPTCTSLQGRVTQVSQVSQVGQVSSGESG